MRKGTMSFLILTSLAMVAWISIPWIREAEVDPEKERKSLRQPRGRRGRQSSGHLPGDQPAMAAI